MGVVCNFDDMISNATTMTIPRNKKDEQGVGEWCSAFAFGIASATSAMGLFTKFDGGSRDQEGVSTLVSLVEIEEEHW
jgi:hypothetical protein